MEDRLGAPGLERSHNEISHVSMHDHLDPSHLKKKISACCAAAVGIVYSARPPSRHLSQRRVARSGEGGAMPFSSRWTCRSEIPPPQWDICDMGPGGAAGSRGCSRSSMGMSEDGSYPLPGPDHHRAGRHDPRLSFYTWQGRLRLSIAKQKGARTERRVGSERA